jgi:hypothetical protein
LLLTQNSATNEKIPDDISLIARYAVAVLLRKPDESTLRKKIVDNLGEQALLDTISAHFKPELFNRVPHKYIASILGMAPETLSRLRGKQIS